MMSEEIALQTIIQSPKLALVVQEMQHILAAEEQRRADFYNTVTPSEKAEFINGNIVLHSPVRLRHNRYGKLLLSLLDAHVRRNGLGYVGYEKLLISLTRNDYEPDICFFGREKSADFTPDQRRFPAPDFIVEILSPSTAANDRGIKFVDYAAHGVTEYWLIDPANETVEQYLLHEGSYQLSHKLSGGTISSNVVADFLIPVRAIFDEAENLTALQMLLR